jgi:hypothetical protein
LTIGNAAIERQGRGTPIDGRVMVLEPWMAKNDIIASKVANKELHMFNVGPGFHGKEGSEMNTPMYYQHCGR